VTTEQVQQAIDADPKLAKKVHKFTQILGKLHEAAKSAKSLFSISKRVWAKN
jgi:hypothetical protein